MPVPTFEQCMVPVLKVLSDGGEHRRKDVRIRAVESLNLTDAELAETLPGGGNRARNRVGWAISYLSQAGAIERPQRGVLVITDVGRTLLAAHPNGLTRHNLEGLPGYEAFRERSRTKRAQRREDREGASGNDPADSFDESPLERLAEAISELDTQVSDDLVQRIREMPPEFLERAVLKLLRAMGYGGSDDSEEHLGQSSDGGVDGVIRQDALGLERIYVQAKRYAADNSVGAPSVRNFTGALEGFSASGGVFITTSRFSSEALAFVERLSRPIVLIDGEELGRLMVEYGVGVTTTQTLHVHEVDENFFEE